MPNIPAKILQIYLFIYATFFSPKNIYYWFLFSSDSLVAKLTHLNIENCGIQDLNSDHSNNILDSCHLSYTYGIEKAS
jgi:hypothetical protein